MRTCEELGHQEQRLGHQVQRFGLGKSIDSARTKVGNDGKQMKLELTQKQGTDQD